MKCKKYVGILVALSIANAASIGAPQTLLAQGLRERIKNRIQQEQQQEQQNSGQPNNGQANAMQQPYAGQPMPGQQPYAGQPAMQVQPQQGAPEVSMVTLQTQPGPNGQQMVITPKGLVVPLPGPGVNGSVVPIYMGSQGGFWYIDKNNQQVDLTAAVHAMQSQPMPGQAMMQQPMQQPVASVPQYAPAPPNYGASAATTAAAAGLGAMTGAAMASSANWNNVPYGTPVHYGAGAVPYYNQGGKPVYVNNSTNVAAGNTVAAGNEVNAYHANTMQQQQNWYKQQQVQQSSNWNSWQKQPTTNPFVRQEYQAAGYGQAANAAHYGQTGADAAHYGQTGASAAHYGQTGADAAHYGQTGGAAEASGRGHSAEGGSEASGRRGRSSEGGEASGGRRGRSSEGGEASGGRRGRSSEGGGEAGGGRRGGGRSRGER